MILKIAIGLPVIFFAGVMGVWVSDRDPPISLISVTAMNESIQPGGQLRVSYSVRRFRSCGVHIDRLLFDANAERYVLEDIDFAAAPGPLGDATYTVGINIPRRFAEGVGRYQVITRYECNPLHNFSPIVVTGPLITFTVKGPPTPMDQSPRETTPSR